MRRLAASRDYGIDLEVVATIAAQVKRVHEMGVQIALVVGGGNIFRGLAASERGFDRATGDYMGMLATVINALALQDALERTGIPARTMTAIQMPQVAEPYIRRRAVRHLEKGRVVILAAGTGNPYFTTDTTAALRAVEIEADVILKATKVDGVYTADPKRDPKAAMLAAARLPRGAQPRHRGDGQHRAHPVHGQRRADRRLQPADAGQHRARGAGRGDRHAGRSSAT